MILGVRRAGVSVAWHKLLKEGLIGYARRNISMRHRKGLEASACECDDVVDQRFEQFYADYRQAAG